MAVRVIHPGDHLAEELKELSMSDRQTHAFSGLIVWR